jgi:aryl-alcohol dehydrogenase-like predicted oxidoreductase
LVLGTAQFGYAYGIANQSGQVSRDEAAAILDHAWKMGVHTLDTAIAYGESEQRLGEIGIARWRVISKLPAIPDSCADVAGSVQEWVMGSLKRLRIPKLWGLLLHQPHQLLGPQGDALFEALLAIKDQGIVEKIGVSIYDPGELDALCSRYRLDLVQAPFNVLDRRLATSGWLHRLRQAGIEVHTRSTFLQGLLLMEASKRPTRFDRWHSLWVEWDRWLEGQALTPLQACMGFVLSHPEIDCVVVGVDSLRHLQEILRAANTKDVSVPLSLATDDLQLVNPSNWAKI